MQELFRVPLSAPYAGGWPVRKRQQSRPRLKNTVPNDFGVLLASTTELKAIAFNGKKSAEWFERWVKVDTSGLRKLVLPSTSPAAAMAFEKKLAAWAVLKEI